MNANRCEIDFTNNGPLRDLFAGKRAGDTVELKVKMKMVSGDDNGAVLDIVKIIAPESDTPQEGEDTGSSPSAKEPAMMVMRGKQKVGASSY